MKNNFLTNTYKWIKGVTIIDSWKKWKNIWIFLLTHWNEPVWVHVADYLINIFNIQKKLLVWKVFFIIINIKAYEKYLLQDDFLDYRFINNNMNRIYKKNFVAWSYEFERLNELKKIFDEIDICIDLHSVASWNDIIWITDEKHLDLAKHIFDVENILIDKISNTWAMIGYFIDKWKIAFGLECWNHIWKDAYKNWINNVLNLLSYFWIINYKIQKNIELIWIYKFITEIFPKSFNFKYSKKYINFEKIWINEVYAIDNNYKYINNYKKNVYIWLIWKKTKIWDWNWFLFEKKIIIKRPNIN